MATNVRQMVTTAISAGVAGLLKQAGFKKEALTFRRRLGSTIHVINVQLSHGNFGDVGRFYVNVGICFDDLRRMDRQSLLERPKEHECHFRNRLEALIPEAPEWWEITEKTDTHALRERLALHLSELLERLCDIDSPKAMLAKKWLKVGDELLLSSRLRYLVGDHESALADLHLVADFFSDRQGMSVAELIERENMPALGRSR